MLINVPPEVTVLAMDVHKNTISTGVLEPGVPLSGVLVDRISTDEESIRRLIGRFGHSTDVERREETIRLGSFRGGPSAANSDAKQVRPGPR